MFNAMGVPFGEQIEHKMLSSAIEKAQEKIEGNNFGIRKNLLEYDQVMNDQREIIYGERRRVLDGENMRSAIYKMITDRVEDTVDHCVSDEEGKKWDVLELNELLIPVIPMQPLGDDEVQSLNANELKHMLKERAVKLYEAKEAEFPCLRCSLQGIVFVCSGYFGNLLTFNLLFYFYMEQQADGFFLNVCRHLIKHFKSGHLVLNQRKKGIESVKYYMK